MKPIRSVAAAFIASTLIVACSETSPTDAPAPATTLNNAEVQTVKGAMKGVVEEGVAVFRGVPFAAAPVGDLRWRPPQAAASWDGVRDASAFGSSCAENEDCLYLNVYTPASATSADKLPVFVWIHGGGFAGGSGAGADGTTFAQNGVILVSINYRLSRAGWFAHPALIAEYPDELKGNYGNMDQVAALEWVRDNIEAFGGDPANVTVGGSSAGAISAAHLMLAPQAQGLFAKAISESNFGRLATAPIRSDTEPSIEAAGLEWAGLMGIEGEGTEAAAALRALTLEQLRAPADVQSPVARPRPLADGRMITGTIVEGFEQGKQAAIPYLFGDTDDDASLFRRGIDSEGRYAALSGVDGFLAAYDPDGDVGADRTIAYLMADESNREPNRALARLHADRAPTYVYHFAYVPEATRGEAFGAGHTAERYYVFGEPSEERPYDDEGQAVSDALNAYWVAFIKSGDPGSAGGVRWPAFNTSDEPRLVVAPDGALNVQNKIEAARLDWVEAQANQ